MKLDLVEGEIRFDVLFCLLLVEKMAMEKMANAHVAKGLLGLCFAQDWSIGSKSPLFGFGVIRPMPKKLCRVEK